MLSVYVSIINFNGNDNTLDCLRSLEKLHLADYLLHVVVIDNGSENKFIIPENSFTKLSLTVLRNENNIGFAGGHNMGVSYALAHDADYVMILNNDTVVDKNILTELLKVIKKDKLAGIVTPKIYFAPGFEFHKDRYRKRELGNVFWYAGGIMDWDNVIGLHRGVNEVDKGQYDMPEATNFASGCCMLIKSEVFKKVGLFDQRYFLYYEDSDFNLRTKNVGYSIRYTPKAVIWHKNAGSAGGSGSELQDYYITRNRLLFGMQYAPWRTKFALLRESLRLFVTGREWQKKGILDFYFKKFGKGSFAV
jgi:GT2 family glycosyltransferase